MSQTTRAREVRRVVVKAAPCSRTGFKSSGHHLFSSVMRSHWLDDNAGRHARTADVSMLISRAWRRATSPLHHHIARYTSMARDYNAAVAALNTLQSNFSIVDAIRKSGKGMNQNAIPEMIDWVKKTGYEV